VTVLEHFQFCQVSEISFPLIIDAFDDNATTLEIKTYRAMQSRFVSWAGLFGSSRVRDGFWLKLVKMFRADFGPAHTSFL